MSSRAPFLAVSSLALAACGSNAGPPDAKVYDAPPPGGTFSLTWSLHDAAGGAALQCSDISAQAVTVSITNDAAGFGVTDLFSCTSDKGTTRVLDPGKYTLAVELDGGTGALAPVQRFMHVEVKSQQDTALGNVDFSVVADGGIALALKASGASSNCGAGGAGIDAMTLQMQDTNAQCVPATFMIAAGASSSASTYTSDCNTLPAGPCIESDQKITVTGLRSGPIRLVMVGDVGGKACWSGVNILTVPAMNAVKDYGTVPFLHDNTICPKVDAM